MPTTRIIAISDTHGHHRSLDVPDGDVLVHAGDLTNHGELEQIEDFNTFLNELPHEHKIVIAGNHDFCFERHPKEAAALLTNCVYLKDEAVEARGIKFYGSPWQPWFFDWAFNLQRGPEIKKKWDLIPKDTDVLITHGPPLGFGDTTVRGEQVGCRDLLDAVIRIRPALHVFGHIHEAYGQWSNEHTHFVNPTSCDLQYRPINKPIVFEYNQSS